MREGGRARPWPVPERERKYLESLASCNKLRPWLVIRTVRPMPPPGHPRFAADQGFAAEPLPYETGSRINQRTIGQLAEEPLFYLRSRGIGEEEARGLLIYAFASELVDRMKIEPVREAIRRAMFRQMRFPLRSLNLAREPRRQHARPATRRRAGGSARRLNPS